MPKSWETMTDRERDARCARLLGWAEHRIADPVTRPTGDGGTITLSAILLNQNDEVERLPFYTTSLDAARLLLDEVKRRGKEDAFGLHLANIIDPYTRIQIGVHGDYIFAIAFATAEQQCHAAVLVLEADPPKE